MIKVDAVNLQSNLGYKILSQKKSNSESFNELNCNKPKHQIPVKYYQSFCGISMPFKVNGGLSLNVPEVDFEKYKEISANSVKDIQSRRGIKGQFLNWVEELPKTEIKNLDKIYERAQKAKQGDMKDIVVIGIGGSRHTTESLTKMLGVDKHAHFYSAVDSDSLARMKDSIDLDKTQFLIVSKSGGTLETNTGYQDFKKIMQNHLSKEDVSNRFYAVTDESSEKSSLRRLVDKGELQDAGIVHDDVGGRFSIFDDATIFTLAFLGVKKEDIKSMLEASLKAQKEYLEPDYNKNDALKLAIAKVDAVNKGRDKHFSEYFGDAFYGTTLWETQLKNESLKAKISTAANVGPAYLHYNAESDLDDNNTTCAYTFVYVKPSDNTMKAITKGVPTAYRKQGHPVCEVALNDLSPESIAKFIELKHFETIYTGNMLRRQNGDITPKNEALPEVLQPNVEKYKVQVKQELKKL